jgi:hypothetical protein
MSSVENGKSSQWIEQQQVETGLSALQQLAKNRKKGFSLFDAIATMRSHSRLDIRTRRFVKR